MRKWRPAPSAARRGPLDHLRLEVTPPSWAAAMRPTLEVADVLRRHGAAFLERHDAHLGRVERRVMAAIQGLPDARARRARRTVQRLRTGSLRLQLVPQPALHEVPGSGAGRLA